MAQFNYVLAMATAAMLMAGRTQAAVVTVTGGTGSPTATSWGVLPGENSAGASAVITASQPRNGNGSVELSGDRTRFQLGIQYGGFTNLSDRLRMVVAARRVVIQARDVDPKEPWPDGRDRTQDEALPV